jgi:broad specificity polyphosphatase/5'/3'-nucleotidase SurE
MQLTPLTTGVVRNQYKIETNPFGKTFAWLKESAAAADTKALEQKADVYWTKHGYVAVTPLKLDLINVPAISIIKEADIKIDSLPVIRNAEIKKYE